MKANAKILRAFFHQVGIPQPEAEYSFAPGRKWRFDYAWPDHKVAMEVEGGIFKYGRHNRAAGFVKDLEKYNTAAAYGWRLLRVQPADLAKKPVELSALIRLTLRGTCNTYPEKTPP